MLVQHGNMVSPVRVRGSRLCNSSCRIALPSITAGSRRLHSCLALGVTCRDNRGSSRYMLSAQDETAAHLNAATACHGCSNRVSPADGSCCACPASSSRDIQSRNSTILSCSDTTTTIIISRMMQGSCTPDSQLCLTEERRHSGTHCSTSYPPLHRIPQGSCARKQGVQHRCMTNSSHTAGSARDACPPDSAGPLQAAHAASPAATACCRASAAGLGLCGRQLPSLSAQFHLTAKPMGLGTSSVLLCSRRLGWQQWQRQQRRMAVLAAAVATGAMHPAWQQAAGSMGEDSGDGLEAELASDSSSSGGSSTFSSGSRSSSSSSSGVNVRSRHGKPGRAAEHAAMVAVVHNAPGESVEWVNMCFRKIWRVYQRGLEGWITDLLQPVFDGLINPGTMPPWLLRLRIVEFTLDHEAPYFSNMRRRNSRKDSDLTGVVDLRYTGGARLLLMLELGQGRWRFKIPVLVSDLDVQCALWLKLRLAPMCPWIGTISLAFVGPPAVKVQLSPYNRVRLMRIPVLQNLLNRLLTVDLPGLMVLPERLEISIPPSVTSIAEAAVGRDTIMRAVASAVLQVDSLEQALLAALPLGPQADAGGVSLPELFRGELTVMIREGRDLPVWGMPWQSNPWVRLVLGEQAVSSRRDSETSTASRHGSPVWNQEVQFLVEDPEKQVLEVYVNDSHITGRPKVGKATFALKDLPSDGRLSKWLPLVPINPGQEVRGEVLLDITFKTFEDDDQDSGFREAQEYARAMQLQSESITDIRSAAAASSRAAVAASAAISAIAMTKAAAARAAARAAQAAKDAGSAALSTVTQQQQQPQQPQQQQQQRQLLALPPPKANGSSGTPSAAAEQQHPQDKKKEDHDKDDGSSNGGGGGGVGGGVLGGNGRSATSSMDQDDAASAAAKRREEALREAFERRITVRTTRAGGTAAAAAAAAAAAGGSAVPPAAAAAAPAPSYNGSTTGSSNGHGLNGAAIRLAPQRQSSSGGLSDMSVTLPDDLMTESSSEDEEALAVERAQQAVVNILEKSKRMEAAVAELAALAAGSPMADVALQHAATKAAAGASGAVAALSPTASVAGSTVGDGKGSLHSSSVSSIDRGSSGSHGGSTVSSIDRGSSGSHGGSSSSRTTVGSFASDYSIWGEERNQSTEQQGQEEGLLHVIQQQQQQHELIDSSHHQPLHQQHIPGFIVRIKDGNEVLSEVITGTNGFPQQVDKAVQAAFTDESPAAAVAGVAAAAAAAGAAQQKSQAAEQSQPWWGRMAFWLPGYRAMHEEEAASSQGGPAAEASPDAAKAARDAAAAGTDPDVLSEPKALLAQEPLSTAQRAWWQPLIDNDFVRSLPGAKSADGRGKGADSSEAAAAAQEASSQGREQQQEPSAAGDGKSWWSFITDLLPKGDDSVDNGAAAEDSSSSSGGSKPVEAIVIPPDLPLEDIAREVAKLKEDAWRSKEDHLQSLWAKTVERNDRSWLMLVSFLLSVAIGLLAIVAYRLAGLPGGADDVAAVLDSAAGAAGGGGDGGVATSLAGQVPLMLMSLLAAYMAGVMGGL